MDVDLLAVVRNMSTAQNNYEGNDEILTIMSTEIVQGNVYLSKFLFSN